MQQFKDCAVGILCCLLIANLAMFDIITVDAYRGIAGLFGGAS